MVWPHSCATPSRYADYRAGMPACLFNGSLHDMAVVQPKVAETMFRMVHAFGHELARSRHQRANMETHGLVNPAVQTFKRTIPCSLVGRAPTLYNGPIGHTATIASGMSGHFFLTRKLVWQKIRNAERDLCLYRCTQNHECERLCAMMCKNEQKSVCLRGESNTGPFAYEAKALTTELRRLVTQLIEIYDHFVSSQNELIADSAIAEKDTGI
jgi:hypothetical protein